MHNELNWSDWFEERIWRDKFAACLLKIRPYELLPVNTLLRNDILFMECQGMIRNCSRNGEKRDP